MNTRRQLYRLIRCAVAAAVLVLWSGCEDDGGGSLGDGHDFGNNDPNLYVAVGDSITAGLGVAPWPSHLSAMLGKPVINLGVGGATSADGVSRTRSALARHHPGFILIFYGSNDISKGRDDAYIINNLRNMIASAWANKTIPVVATLPPMFYEHKRFHIDVVRVNAQIRAMAAAQGTQVADVEQAFGDSPQYLMSDGLHPNAQGMMVIAETFADVL